MKFKVGDKVRCVENTTTKRDFGGGGYKLGLEFNITKILRGSTGIYYGGFDGMGVFEEYLELVAFSEKIDFTQKGTKLPIISKRTQYRCSKWNDSLKNSESITPYSDLISFGTQYHNEIEYILAEFPGFTGRNYFMYPISEIERLAKEQGMIKETVKTKELPKSFCIKQDQSNPLWNKYIAWLNEKYDPDVNGKGYDYYGITKSGEFDFWNDKKHFDQIITLEEWNEIVNGKQEKIEVMNKTIKKSDLKKIHDVACSSWQNKISQLAATRNVFGDTIELTQKEIDEMFKAADSKQTKVLEEVFGKQQGELDLRSNDINLKVDGLPVFGRSCDSSSESLIGLPLDEYTKNVFYLNKNYEWVLKGNKLTVTRK